MLDQPKNTALVTKYLGYGKASWWPNFCKFAAIWYIASKLVIISIAIYFMTEAENGSDASWNVPEHSFSKWIMNYELNGAVVVTVVSTFIFLLFLDQIFSACVLWKLALKAETDISSEESSPSSNDILSLKKEIDVELSPLNNGTTHYISDESSGDNEGTNSASNISDDDAAV